MSSDSQPSRTRRVNVAALTVLVAAAAVSALAGWSALGLWQGLPYSQIKALSGEEVVAAFRAASLSAPEQVREAWLLTDVGKQFTAALRDEAALERLSGEVASYAAGQTRTLDWVCFDGFVLPGETALRVKVRPWEIDFEQLVYEVLENPLDASDKLGKWEETINVTSDRVIDLTSPDSDWTGRLRVEVIDYPAFYTPPYADQAPWAMLW